MFCGQFVAIRSISDLESLVILVELEISCPGGVLPSKRLVGMCRWMGSHFHNWVKWVDYTI